MHPAQSTLRLATALVVASLAATGCTLTHSRPEAGWRAAAAAGGTAQLNEDSRGCRAQAQQAVSDYQAHGRKPALSNVSSLGVGVAVVVAEARAADEVRRGAFDACMRSAGWELQAQR